MVYSVLSGLNMLSWEVIPSHVVLRLSSEKESIIKENNYYKWSKFVPFKANHCLELFRRRW